MGVRAVMNEVVRVERVSYTKSIGFRNSFELFSSFLSYNVWRNKNETMSYSFVATIDEELFYVVSSIIIQRS